jgi:lysyl-tRNA synthetase class 2
LALGSGHSIVSGAQADWQPVATLSALRRRADMLALARQFFASRAVLEVETPILSVGAVSDPQIESLHTRIAGLNDPFYLSTSPEHPMKRLLAAGSGDIYQICKVFRDGELGRWHNPEFTMIEWYRLGFDDDALMTEVEEFAAALLGPQRRLLKAERLTYAQALRLHAGVDANADDDSALQRAAADHGAVCRTELDRDAALDLLMGLVVGPKLGMERPCFIHDYPASQASLARLKPGVPPLAARFEFYVDGIELANGFHELANADEQRSRFAADLARRREKGLIQPPVDERLLAALRAGMPECAGVALGFDRLVAIALRASRLSAAMAFPIDLA